MSVNSFSGQPAIPASYGFTAGKNKVINGDFGVWQRGTSYTSNNYGIYGGPDRFRVSSIGGTSTCSQQTFTAGTAPVSGYEGTYFFRVATASSGMSYWDIGQPIESVRTFAGQTVTVSLWAKASVATTVLLRARQDFGTGGSTAVNNDSAPFALTTSWVRYTATISVPSISGKTIGTGDNLGVYLQYSSGTINSVNIDVWGFQIEAGATATSFQTATGTIQGELAACQRYYYRAIPTQVYGCLSNLGTAETTTLIRFTLPVPAVMRVTPTSVDYSTLTSSRDGLSSGNAVSAVTVSGYASPYAIQLYATVSGVTAFSPYYIYSFNSTSAYVGVSAEL